MNDIDDLILILPYKPRNRGRLNAGDPSLTLQSGRDRVEPIHEDQGGGGDPPTIGSLVVIEDGSGVRVTWGTVENVVPSNINSSFSTSGMVYVEIEMNTQPPYNVESATIKTGIVPDDDPPDPDTGEPPSKIYFVLGDGEGNNTNGTYGGSIGVYLQSAGTTCRPGDPGDPEADPPIPPKEGGIVDILQWVTYRK